MGIVKKQNRESRYNRSLMDMTHDSRLDEVGRGMKVSLE